MRKKDQGVSFKPKQMKPMKIPSYYVIIWNFNQDQIEYYDIIPYLIDCWKNDKKKRHKTWDYSHKYSEDDTRMPETFDEFKDYVKSNCRYLFWAKCEYEIIVCGWPIRKNETKIDAYDQIKQNIDVITDLFMNHILHSTKRLKKI